MKCPKCPSTDIDTDTAGGMIACRGCGHVLEEGVIVNEVSFVENAQGNSAVMGQFVSSTGIKQYPGATMPGTQKESREITALNGRKKITQLANSLNLTNHHIEAAQRLFLLAVQHNFIQGRKTMNVVSSCLYIVCRREKTSHMLIDFADALQTNVYILGNTFLRFSRLLQLKLPIIDPSLYIDRFASRLEFGEKVHHVAMSALRLVARMKRDWIQTGRRPSGICGAALLIAARMHGFRRTQREIVAVVRIGELTLRKRIDEFEMTPAVNWTREDVDAQKELDNDDEGKKIDWSSGCDPPAFTRARRKEENQLEREREKTASLMRELQKDAVSQGTARDHDPISKEINTALSSGEMIQALQRGNGQGDSSGPQRAAKRKHVPAPPPIDAEKFLKENPLPEPDEEAEGEKKPPPDEETLSDIPDEDIAMLLHDKREVENKTRIWNHVNADYLQEQAEKQRQMELNKQMGILPDSRKSKKRRRGGGRSTAANAGVVQRKVTTKINDRALEALFAKTPTMVPGAGGAITRAGTMAPARTESSRGQTSRLASLRDTPARPASIAGPSPLVQMPPPVDPMQDDDDDDDSDSDRSAPAQEMSDDEDEGYFEAD